MASPFAIKRSNIAPSEASLSGCFIAFMFYPSRGLISPTVENGIQVNCFQRLATLGNHCLLIHIEKFVTLHSVKQNVSISQGHMLDGERDVSWQICWTYPMHKCGDWVAGILVV